jgi:ketosteroid isomerase-like protein
MSHPAIWYYFARVTGCGKERAVSIPERFAERYYGAYNAGDLDGVLADYAPDAEYRLHGAAGPAALRAVYADQLRAWPDQRLTPRSVVASGDLLVCEVSLTATLAVPWELAETTYEPSGRPITFELVHVIRFRDGLVHLKEGWVDGLAIHRQLAP